MFTIKTYDYECTTKCKLEEHGNKITGALTKRSISCEKLAAFLAKTCRNFSDIRDSLGRTALHLAASVDKYAITEWLLNTGALIDLKDRESGSTALHRSIFYGCVDNAVLLIRKGASLDIMDDDTRQPLQYCCKCSHLKNNTQSENELLVWGSNKNYNLGINSNNESNLPQLVDHFRKEQISIEMLAMSSLHSLFLDKKGNVYAVGHGEGGRLGIASENSLPVPKKVKLPIKSMTEEKIIQLCVSKNHSMILTNRTIYACGTNEFQVLGMKPAPDKILSFKEIPYFNQCRIENLCGILAEECFSVAYSQKELYVWGLNQGQFGINDTTESVLLPKKVLMATNYKIDSVASNNNVIAVCTNEKQILVFYNYKIKVIKPPLLESIKSISVLTEEKEKLAKTTNSLQKNFELKFLILTETNVIYIWENDLQQYLRCSMANVKLSQIDKIFYKRNQVFVLSQGDVYVGTCTKIPVSNIVQDSANAWLSSGNIKKDIYTNLKIRIELKRIANIDRTVNIFCDPDFESFAVLQESVRKYYHIPPLIAEEYSFKKLLHEVHEFDGVHDIVFHVDDQIFYAHKFIIFSRAKGLKPIVENFPEKDIYIKFQNLTGKMFELILKHIYSNYFLTLDDIGDIEQSVGYDFIESYGRNKILQILLDYADKFYLNDFSNNIRSFLDYQTSSSIFDRSKSRFHRLNRMSFPELHDVVIKCANNQEIKVHKCVLVTRLEYFNLMFSHSWAENKFINLTTIPIEYMRPIIDFLYTSDVDAFRKEQHTESYLYNMIVICDQYFINRLRKICEILVLEKMSIRKCGEVLEFACSYNCDILKMGSLDFICQNLSRVLLQRSLEVCDPEYLLLINLHYRKMFNIVFDYRCITPEADAIQDEILLSYVSDFKIDLIEAQDILSPQAKQKPKQKNKESKIKADRKNLEKDAISSLREMNINLELEKLKMNNVNVDVDVDVDDIIKFGEKNYDSSTSWTVHEKKDVKKKLVLGTINANNILKLEEKAKEKFVSLNKLLRQQQPLKSKENIDIQNRAAFSLGDFHTLRSDNLSQKQRKRLSFDSKVDLNKTLATSSPIEIRKPQNPWNIKQQVNESLSPTSVWYDSDINNSSSKDYSFHTPNGKSPNKYFESPKTPKERHSTGAIPKHNANTNSSFSEILEDEKRQKDYFERIKSKSLALTQLEETAISELKEFYNVENVDDEIITIEIKPIQTTMNFATWTKA